MGGTPQPRRASSAVIASVARPSRREHQVSVVAEGTYFHAPRQPATRMSPYNRQGRHKNAHRQGFKANMRRMALAARQRGTSHPPGRLAPNGRVAGRQAAGGRPGGGRVAGSQ